MPLSHPWLSITLISLGAAAEGLPDGLCMAFIGAGSTLQVQCGSRLSTVFTHPELEEVAVLRNEGIVGLLMAATWVEGPRSYVSHSVYLLDSLGKIRRIAPSNAHIRATCGTIITQSSGMADGPTLDLVSGDVIHHPRATRQYCSDDRSTVANVVESTNGSEIEVRRKDQVVHIREKLTQEIDVSPNGRFVAHRRDGKSNLCRLDLDSGSTACIDTPQPIEEPAIDDDGRILFVVGTAEECVYRGGYAFRRPLPNEPVRHDGERDACPEIRMWLMNTDQSSRVSDLGRMPQWLSPAQAEWLVANRNNLRTRIPATTRKK
jgi:hypothetical protein